MNVKEWLCIVILATILVVTTIHFWPGHREEAHLYSGPGIGGNLIALQVVKDLWEIDHKGGTAWANPSGFIAILECAAR